MTWLNDRPQRLVDVIKAIAIPANLNRPAANEERNQKVCAAVRGLKLKRLNQHRQKWFRLRANNERRRRRHGATHAFWGKRWRRPENRQVSRVQIWQGGDPEWALCMSPPTAPPQRLCFSEHLNESMRYFHSVRGSTQKMHRRKASFIDRTSGQGGLPRISGYSDFSKLSFLSTAAAVVLAAEYERWGEICAEIPPTVELDKWNENVFRKLYQLGFFEIVGITPRRDDVIIGSGTTRTMQIVSMKNADDLARVDTSLQTLGEFLDPGKSLPDEIIIDLLTGLSEAISNVTNHAYKDDTPTDYPHIGSLWVAATADRGNNSLTIVVYDQGATIPVTYPRIGRLEKVTRYLVRAIKNNASFDFENDGTYVRAAMKYGGSRTDEKHRGKGLPQMMDVIKRVGSGTMTVYSRGGWCRRSKNGRLQSGAVPFSIGGTLIEWSVELS